MVLSERCCEWVARYGGALAPHGPQDPHLRVQLAQVGAGGEACGENGPRAAHGAACARSFDVACMRMRAEEVPITPPLRRWGVGASFEFPQGGSLG